MKNHENSEQKWGVKQGCVLSPLLFSVLTSKEKYERIKLGSLGKCNKYNSMNFFADVDMVIFAVSGNNLQHNLKELDNKVAKINMKISEEKRKTNDNNWRHKNHTVLFDIKS